MKDLIILFVRRPVTVIMILCALIIAALFSLFSLPVNRLPDFSVPRVTVETIYPGMAANEIRTLVTIPLEDGLSPVKGLERMRSVSRDNRSLISMDFRWGTDVMAAAVLVREAVDAVYPGLPEGVRKPAVTSGDSGNEPHAVIAVSSHNGNTEFARNLAEYELRARLRRIDGAGSVILVGGDVKEERLSLDVQRLTALGLAPQEFAGLLMQETSDIPAGNAREGNTELVVVSSGKPESTADLARIILPVASGSLTVADAGQLAPATARRESVFVYNGKEAAALEIYRRPGSDPLKLSREIRKTIDDAASLFSRDVQIEIVHDSSPSLISGIKSLIISASLGAAAVITVLFLFIRRLKYCLLASLSIPVSIASGICMLSVMGKSLNSMSLGGLAMGIGLVSDVSVLVLDLLHRSFGNRDTIPDPKEIGNKAFSIADSSAASTITTAIVFLPVIMLPGALGSLFGDIAVSIAASVSAGWFYAQFCLPSMYRLNFKNKRINFFHAMNFAVEAESRTRNFNLKVLRAKYHCLLIDMLRAPKKIFTVAVILCVTGGIALFSRPAAFINPDEAEEVRISAVFPPGTVLETAGWTGREISRLVSGLPSVKTVYGRAGAEEEDINRRADIDYTREELVLNCILEKRAKPEKALAEIQAAIASAEHGNAVFSAYFPKDRTEVLLGLSSERTFVIVAKDRDELNERSALAKETFNNSSIAVNFKPQGQRPELRLYPNREASAYLSMPAAQIAQTLYVLNEGIIAVELEIEGRPLNVRVTGENQFSDDPVKRLEQTPLITPQGKTVRLSSLGRIERKEAQASLARLDRSDVVYADILSAGKSGKKIPAQVKEFAAQFSWFVRADESAFARYKNSLFTNVILSLILLYMTMGAQFESFLLPLILMMCIPLSLAGAGPALLAAGSKIDSGAVLGLAALFGLVVNNSLVLFEISDEKIRRGCSAAGAVCRGAVDRFQAILITTATTIFALFPLVVRPMSNSQKSMAAAMLGGLTASTLLSLFAVPPVLIVFFKWKIRREEEI